jgi:thiamine biosynthesis lipoprotein
MVQKKLFIFLLTLILCISPLLTSCTKKASSSSEPISKTEFVLGTLCTVKIFDNAPESVLDKAFERLHEIENKMTINAQSSEIMSVNSKSGEDFVKVSEDTFYVVETGKYFSELSGGGFDISIGPVVKLWNIGTDNARVPSQAEIDAAKPLVNYKNILLDKSQKKIMLKQKGMIIDLGGIAKGYAADEVYRILKENGVKHAIINLGGNVFAMGSKPDGSDWKIGIQNPFSSRGEFIGTVNVKDKTIVSSGVYERYFEKNGKRYHHILDTKTGYPVDNSLVSVTIITNKSINADALSTSVFVMGLEKGMKFVENLDDVEAIFITKESKVYITSGLKNNFKITDNKFVLKN